MNDTNNQDPLNLASQKADSTTPGSDQPAQSPVEPIIPLTPLPTEPAPVQPSAPTQPTPNPMPSVDSSVPASQATQSPEIQAEIDKIMKTPEISAAPGSVSEQSSPVNVPNPTPPLTGTASEPETNPVQPAEPASNSTTSDQNTPTQ